MQAVPQGPIEPNIGPTNRQSLQEFVKVCSTTDPEEVTRLAAGDHAPNNESFVNERLISAIVHKQLNVISYLIDRVAVIDARVTAFAARAASQPIFEILKSHGWDVNSSFMGGHTALIQCIHNEPVTKLLLSYGADPNLGPPLDPQPHSPSATDSGAVLNTAAAISKPHIIDLLIQHGAKLENSLPLHAAVTRDVEPYGEGIPMMAHLLQLGVDINGTDESRGFAAFGTPLHYAVRRARIDTVRFLLRKGADVRAKVLRGEATALDLARQTRREDLIALVESYMRRANNCIVSLGE